MDSPAPSRLKLILAFAAIYLIWGSTYLAIRVAVETLPPFLMSGMRFGIAGMVLFTVLLARGTPIPTAAQVREHAVAGAFLLLGGNAVVSWAEQRVPSGLTTLILGTSPIFMVLIEWFRPRGTRPNAGLWLGVAVGIGGLLLLLGPGALPPGVRPPLSCVVALLFTSVSWWIGSLCNKHARHGAEPLMGAAIQMLCGSVLMVPLGLGLGEGPRLRFSSVHAASWVAFSYLVCAGSLIAYPVYVWLLKHTSTARASTYAYVNPVIAVFLGWLILGEPLTPRTLVAATVIVGAVAIITIQKTRIPRQRMSRDSGNEAEKRVLYYG